MADTPGHVRARNKTHSDFRRKSSGTLTKMEGGGTREPLSPLLSGSQRGGSSSRGIGALKILFVCSASVSILLLGLFSLGVGYSRDDGPSWPLLASQHNALVKLAVETQVEQWGNSTGWARQRVEADSRGGLRQGHYCTWLGVTCNAEGSVTALALRRNRLRGSIPSEIGDLTQLEYLSLDHNKLQGVLPIGLASLSKLGVLQMSGNAMSGELPAWLGSLAMLRSIYLDGNGFEGRIPSLARMVHLEELSLHHNNLDGTISRDLSVHYHLSYLSLSNNQLKGAIPDLSELDNLKTLALDGNELTGFVGHAPDHEGGACAVPAGALRDCSLADNAFGCLAYPRCLRAGCDGGVCDHRH